MNSEVSQLFMVDNWKAPSWTRKNMLDRDVEYRCYIHVLSVYTVNMLHCSSPSLMHPRIKCLSIYWSGGCCLWLDHQRGESGAGEVETVGARFCWCTAGYVGQNEV